MIWQENWESHVDLLEEKVFDPVYHHVIMSTDMKKYGIAHIL